MQDRNPPPPSYSSDENGSSRQSTARSEFELEEESSSHSSSQPQTSSSFESIIVGPMSTDITSSHDEDESSMIFSLPWADEGDERKLVRFAGLPYLQTTLSQFSDAESLLSSTSSAEGILATSISRYEIADSPLSTTDDSYTDGGDTTDELSSYSSISFSQSFHDTLGHNEFDEQAKVNNRKKDSRSAAQRIWYKIFGPGRMTPHTTVDSTDLVCSPACRYELDELSESSDQETFTERLQDGLPKCGVEDFWAMNESSGGTTELHSLIMARKWHIVRCRLEILSEFCEEVPREQRYNVQLAHMVRQVDEHGRTPLSLACGKSSAPLDIIKAMIQIHPVCSREHDKNENLPIHHFCHSYQRTEDKISKDEVEVLDLLHKAHPYGVKSINMFGNTPLHIYLEHQCRNYIRKGTSAVVFKLLRWYSKAVFVVNEQGSLPLHLFCKAWNRRYELPKNQFSNSQEIKVICIILGVKHKSNKSALETKNKLGLTPFFYAVIYDADIQIWKGMLYNLPEAALICNAHGVSPIITYWNMFVSLRANTKFFTLTDNEAKTASQRIDRNRRELSKVTSLHYLRVKAPRDLVDFWKKMELMLRAARSCSNSIRNNGKWRALHTVCSIADSPPGLLKFALQLFPSQAKEKDENGNLPLHISASLGGRSSTLHVSDNVHSIIKRLLSVYKQGASKRNAKGQLPLHIALNSGHVWTGGVASILYSYETSVRLRDPVTQMYPFMIAAAQAANKRSPTRPTGPDAPVAKTNKSDIEQVHTVYELLRAAPELVRRSDNVESDNNKPQKEHRASTKSPARKQVINNNTSLKLGGKKKSSNAKKSNGKASLSMSMVTATTSQKKSSQNSTASSNTPSTKASTSNSSLARSTRTTSMASTKKASNISSKSSTNKAKASTPMKGTRTNHGHEGNKERGKKTHLFQKKKYKSSSE